MPLLTALPSNRPSRILALLRCVSLAPVATSSNCSVEAQAGLFLAWTSQGATIVPLHVASGQIRCRQPSSNKLIPHDMATVLRLVPLLGLVFWATAASADVQHNKWCQITTPDFELGQRPAARKRPRAGPRIDGFQTRRGNADRRAAGRIAAHDHRFSARAGFPAACSRRPTLTDLEFYCGNGLRSPSHTARGSHASGPHFPSTPATCCIFVKAKTTRHGTTKATQRLLSSMYASKQGVVVGYVPSIVRPSMARLEPTLAELVEVRRPLPPSPHQRRGILAKAWLLVHMLELGHFAGLPAFHLRVPQMLKMIDDGESAEIAMQRGLGVDMATLQDHLAEYGKRKSLPRIAVVVDFGEETEMDYRCLDRMEIRHTPRRRGRYYAQPRLRGEALRGSACREPGRCRCVGGIVLRVRRSRPRTRVGPPRARGRVRIIPRPLDRVAKLEANE